MLSDIEIASAATLRPIREIAAETLDIAEDLRHRATHDMLTQALNRAGFMQVLDDSLASAADDEDLVRGR